MRWVTLRIYRNQGGVLKGQIAPGDAHPYLGLFDGQKYRRYKHSFFSLGIVVQKTAIYYNTLMASPILGLGLAVFGYRERAVILLTALFLGLQNSKVDPYRKNMQDAALQTYLPPFEDL